jgi:hypothetical protein
MNKNENTNYFGYIDDSKDKGKKNIKLKDVFIIPNNKKIQNDISSTQKELNKKDIKSKNYNIPKTNTIFKEEKKEEKKAENKIESIAERNLKIKNKKTKGYKD